MRGEIRTSRRNTGYYAFFPSKEKNPKHPAPGLVATFIIDAGRRSPVPVTVPFRLFVLECRVIRSFVVRAERASGETEIRGQTAAGGAQADRDELVQSTITGRHMVLGAGNVAGVIRNERAEKGTNPSYGREDDGGGNVPVQIYAASESRRRFVRAYNRYRTPGITDGYV